MLAGCDTVHEPAMIWEVAEDLLVVQLLPRKDMFQPILVQVPVQSAITQTVNGNFDNLLSRSPQQTSNNSNSKLLASLFSNDNNPYKELSEAHSEPEKCHLLEWHKEA